MEISPILLVQLLIHSFLFGTVTGFLYDIHRLIRVLFGVRYSQRMVDELYKKNIPILKRPLRAPKNSRLKNKILPILIFLQDVFLFVFAAIGCVILNYYFNYGKFRIYTIVAMIIGFVIYYFTVGKLVMLISECLIFILRAAVTIFFTLIFRPIEIFVEFFGKNAKKLCSNVEKSIAKKRKLVYNNTKVKCVMNKAEHGFLCDAA